ncbi:MAG: efflux RND transporter permease subunit [Myxococcota bacterium]
MARFFIDRPVFAWVIALFVLIGGALSITRLPIAQYPSVAPPSVVVRATYPGASATVLDESVTSIITQQLNGAKGLMYVEAQSDGNGTAQITASFVPGTDPELAAVEVQNRIKRIEARLPAPVKQLGVQVTKSNAGFLMFASIVSTDGALDSIGLGDYLNRSVAEEIRRVPGVGEAQVFGTERAMRVWLHPDALVGRGLTPTDVLNALRAQNAVVSAGSFGELPSASSQEIYGAVVVSGQLATPEAFADVILRANVDGSVVRLGDVARIEIGGQSYAYASRVDGHPAASLGVQLSPEGNAVATAEGVRAKLEELSAWFPPGVEVVVPVDNSKFVETSIEEVVRTLAEAIFLVFLVMYLVLQDLRSTLIPTIVVPVALMGAFGTMLAFGFSINVVTMFGLVLAIGILVDDAIVVVENVERIMREEGLGPRDATVKAMQQISGAIVGITLVLVAVFLPMAVFSGAVGVIYQQFSLSLVSSMAFSPLMALTLTPALCATMLRPIAPGASHEKRGVFGWFNRSFERVTVRYTSLVARVLRGTGRALLVYGAVVTAMAVLYLRLPTSFLPVEDMGMLTTSVQLPPGASANRTDAVIEEVERTFLAHPAVESVVSIRGFSFAGRGQNAGIVFVALKDYGDRDQGASEVAAEVNAAFSRIRDGVVFAVNPPPIRELGNATGFAFRLEDRGGVGHDALLAARDQLLAAAAERPVLASVRTEGLDDTPQLSLDVDRAKANALGVSFGEVNDALSVAFGSAYANDFPNFGRQQQVIVQADAASRAQPDDLLSLHVRNGAGEMVPLSAFATTRWIVGPTQLVRYNGYPALKIAGDVAPGASTGDGMAEMERLAAALPAGIGYEWTGLSLEEQTSGAQAPALFALSFAFVFLCLAALYESWSIPAAVMLVVPLGVLGAVLATSVRGLPNDVYFKVGLIAIIGLSAKNAILIVEFAKDLHAAEGIELVEATLEAVKLRFRPILMTSLAFLLGVLPLVIANGAGAASQRAIGTAVAGGMASATLLAVFLVPVFFVVVRRRFPGR